MAAYIGTATAAEKSGWAKLDPAERARREAQGMAAWGAWGAKHAASIVDQGGPLGKTTQVSGEGVSEMKNNLVGYVVVEAESHEAAARMFERHPHFSIFPGDSVEVMEVLPIPGADSN